MDDEARIMSEGRRMECGDLSPLFNRATELQGCSNITESRKKKRRQVGALQSFVANFRTVRR
jgi:hypothetical protein